MKKKKIVILHPRLVMGGVDKVLINMLNVLDYNRVEVTLWLLESGGSLENEITDNVKIRYFNSDKYSSDISWSQQIKNELKKHKFISAFRLSFYLLLYTVAKKPELKFYFTHKKDGILDKTHYDLLIDYYGYRVSLLYWGVTGFHAKKRVVWIHGEDGYHSFRAYAYKKYDRIFTVSNGIRNSFLKLNPELNKKTEVFYNIQDTDGIISKSKDPCSCKMIHPAIVTVGRIDPEKGIDRIPECMEKLCQAKYNVHWYIIGNGSEKNKIETECKNKGLSDNIHFLGEQKNPYPYMKNADIYVQPSRSEGFCTATLEAKILKKPVVVTDVPGMREQFIDGKTGIILKEQSTEELFKAIKKLLDFPELREEFVASLSKPDNTVSNDLTKLYSLIK